MSIDKAMEDPKDNTGSDDTVSDLDELEIVKRFIADGDLSKKYNQVRERTRNLLGTPLHIAFSQSRSRETRILWTDHGSTHAESVLVNANEIHIQFTHILKLSQYELFILACSCWCHDLGMFFEHPNFSHVQQRKYHGRVSGNVLNSLEHLLFPLSERERLAISLVCAAHQGRIELSTLSNPFMIRDSEVRLALLGAMLRIADAMDISEKRANQDFLKLFKNLYGKPADPSVFEWSVNFSSKSGNHFKDNGLYYRLELNDEFRKILWEQKGLDKLKSTSHEVYERIKDHWISKLESFLGYIGNYIKYYIADHVISLNVDESDGGGLKDVQAFQNALKNLEIKCECNLLGIAIGIVEPETINAILERREEHYKSLETSTYYWMSSINHDRDISKLMRKIRDQIRHDFERNADVFMFLFNRENLNLSLWNPGGFYEEKLGTADVGALNDFNQELREVTIPIKCGIVGYIAWTGDAEGIECELADPRASFSQLDYKLRLENVVFSKIYRIDEKKNKKSIIGIFLFNFTGPYRNFREFIGKHSNDDSKVKDLNEILGQKHKELINLLDRHRS